IGNILTWLNNCYQSGYLTEKETGLPISEIGSREFFERLITMIAKREGFGDILAEGLLRAGEQLGEKAKAHFTLNVSGVGGKNGYAPRMYITNALLYAMEPRQPIAMLHEVSYLIARWRLHMIRPELSPTTSEVFRAAATKFWGNDKAWDLTTYEGKAIATVKIQDRTYVKDSLILCDCSWPIMDSFNTPDHIGDPTLESRIFSAVTGIDTDEAGLNKYGERIFNLQRGILIREGWKAKESDAPAEFNFDEPIETDTLNPQLIVPGRGEEPVSIKGNALDRKKFEEMRKEFYELRGWDGETGLQKVETLQQLDLSDLAQDLQKHGMVL
ncbi:MAG: aldehyde ferredoxin oxidoreductase C-terminal domain-containing protein, partial [Thermodesulfobacteriota bacterium]|nr:aldehyde ferredoxin oxidoreductase C-terminal domain-containing protein [Thermodesulfobacteriota bacterium]